MPRLAGQQPEYLENQLQAFIDRRRTNPVMFNVAHVLSPSMVTALASYFKDLDPRPLGGAPVELAAAGKDVIIARGGGQPSAVLKLLEEYASFEETRHLLRSTNNAKNLRESIAALNAGKGSKQKLAE